MKLIKIYGKVMDFNDNPIKDAEVEIKDKNFVTVYKTTSDAEGKYVLQVEEGNYIALCACKDYSIKNLEYWAWSVPAYQDLEINSHIDGIELYAMNAWIPQGATPFPTLQIYFRPMSLKRAIEKGGVDVLKTLNIIDIAPEITKEDIIVKIDDEPVEILEINIVKEFSDKNQSVIAYLIQTTLPELKTNLGYYKICITLRDSKTDEKGEGCLYLRKPNYV